MHQQNNNYDSKRIKKQRFWDGSHLFNHIQKNISDYQAIYINTCAFESMLSKDIEVLDSQAIGYRVTFLDLRNKSRSYFLDEKNLGGLIEKIGWEF